MKKNFIKAAIVFVVLILYIFLIPKTEYASINKQTWRTNAELNLQKISLSQINNAVYNKNYNYSFVNQNNKNWSGKTVYGGTAQGSVVTDRHLVFIILNSGTQNGYIYIANKTTGTIEQSIPVPTDGWRSKYGHMNDLTYNPKTKEIFLPYSTYSGTGKVVIFKYNENGSVNPNPTIVNQCSGINCNNIAYNESLDKYIFNNGTHIYIVSRDGNNFKNTPDKQFVYDQKDFKYMIAQSLGSTGRYFYKIFSEAGSINSYQPTYYDSKEVGSNIMAVYDLNTGNYIKALYISNKDVKGELEGVSFDPNDGTMILTYNLMYMPNVGNVNKVAFYKLNIGNQLIDDKEYYFYNNGFVAPKATITAQKDGESKNIIRYFNSNNNLGDGHSNYIKNWKDLSGKRNGTIEGNTIFSDQGYLNLDGINDWVNIGELSNTVYNNITMEVQVSFNEVKDEEMCLLANMETGGYGLILINGKPQFQAYIDGKYEKVVFDEKLLKNRVYNITGTFDGTTLSIYVDGILRNTTKLSEKRIVSKPLNNTVMGIGANPNGSRATGGYLNGKIYSARVYEVALNEQQIKQNMNADRLSTEKLSSNGNKVNITINFSEPVNNFTVDSIELKNGTKGKFEKISDKQYDLEIKNIVESKNLEINIKDGSFSDLTGNKGKGTKIIRYRDNTGPKATIIANSKEIITNKKIIYTISFDEPVTGFNKNSINITNGIKGKFIEVNENKIYSLEVDNVNGENNKISIPINACYDASGNSNIECSQNIIIDNDAPIIKMIKGNPTTSTIGNVTLEVEAEDNQSGLHDKAYSFDGGLTWQSSNKKIFSSNQNLEIQVRDKAGNIRKKSISITKIINLKRIEITFQPSKIQYFEGENFDKTAMKVEGIYDNGTRKEINDYEILNGNNLKVEQKSVIIKYLEQETEQKIIVYKKSNHEISDYKIIEEDSKKYIIGIPQLTSIKELKTKISDEFEVSKGKMKITNENSIIGTGMTITGKLENKEGIYEVVVKGDLTGDGKVKMADLLKLARYKAGIDKDLKGAYLKAGDILENKKIGIPDILKLSRNLAGLDAI